jgi:hypothetical protein
MTNREALILSLRIMGPDEKDAMSALQESPWEDWAPAESNVAYWVNCPRSGHSGNLCDHLSWPFSRLSVCGPCINAWLDEEVEP